VVLGRASLYTTTRFRGSQGSSLPPTPPARAGKAKGKAKAKVVWEESEMEEDEEDDDGVEDAEVKEEDDEDEDEEDEEPISGTLKRKFRPSQSKARRVKRTKRVVEGSPFSKAQVCI
jgi:hypothetical protein